MAGKVVYVLIAISAVGMFSSHVDAKMCSKKKYICGDGKCCCSGTRADCRTGQLSEIPDVPANTTILQFNDNRLMNISRDTFRYLTKLKLSELHLGQNEIEDVYADAFIGLFDLSYLNMSENVNINKTALSIAFNSIQTKKNLTLELNEIRISDEMHEEFFEGLCNISLTKLLLNKNLLKTFNERAFENLKYLQILRLSGNKITDVTSYSTIGLRSLKQLSLDFNEFWKYPPSLCRRNQTMSTYPRLTKLNLNNNWISIIPYGIWSCLQSLRKLSLDKNIIEMIRDNVFTPLTSLKTLSLEGMWTKLGTVELNALNSTSLHELNLNNNGIKFIENQSTSMNIFKACPNVLKLHLSHNSREFSDPAFTELLSPLVNLEYLEGVALYLKAFPPGLLQRLPKLRVLNFDGNKIYTWNRSTFENVTELQYLSLQGNNIKTLTAEQFPEDLLKSLKQLSLADNPFACTCDNLWFRNWIDENVTKKAIELMSWPWRYKCSTPPQWHYKFLEDYRPIPNSCRSHDQMIIVYTSIGSFLLVFTIVFLIVYRQRWYIRYWVYELRRQRNGNNNSLTNNEENVDEQPYDAYVIYNNEDVPFVRQHLIKLVEEKNSMRLCIRHRDSPVGGALMDRFVDDIYASRCIIAVISQHFIGDPWCQFQLDVSLRRQVELRRNCPLLVVMDNLDFKSLSKTWCVILTKTPTVDGCADESDIRYTVFEQKLIQALAK